MGVTYVTGRAGSGKTEYILREAKAAVRAGKRVLVVTPELMTLSMEQALLADLPVLWNLEVLSPSRLQAKLPCAPCGRSSRMACPTIPP